MKTIVKKRIEIIILIGLGLLMIGFKHFLISNLPIEARAYKSDDALMMNMAVSFRNGNWMGKYSGQKLMKGTFYPMFLGLINKLGLNYLCTLNLVNTLAALFFVSQLRGLLKKPVLCFILFTVLLFDPCTTAYQSFQRVYRSSIMEMEILFLWGAYYGIYMESFELKNHIRIREILLILLSCGCLWAMWNTREECFWVLPFIITAVILTGWRYWKAWKERNCSGKSTVLRIGMLVLPFIILFAGNQLITALNKHYYGAPVRLEIVDGSFSKALKSIYSVKHEPEIHRVSVPRAKLERLFAVSPALSQIRTELDAEITRYDHKNDLIHNNGELEDGWFFWALKYAAFNNGIADTLPKSEAYWNTVYQEVEAALDDPSSGLERQSVMPSALMSPMRISYIKMLPERFVRALRYTIGYEGVAPVKIPGKNTNPNYIQRFEAITNNIAVSVSEAESTRIRESLPHLAFAVKWLTRIGDFYRAVNPAAAVIALISFFILVFCLILQKSSETLQALLIICGLLFSLILFTGGVSYNDITGGPLIIYHYLSSAYPLMLGAIWISILYTIRMFFEKLSGKTDPGKEDGKNNYEKTN